MFKKKHSPSNEQSTQARRDREIDRDLQSIYGDEAADSLTQLEVRKRSRWTTFFAVFIPFLACATAIAWAGFFLFAPRATFTGDLVSVAVRSPFTARSGEPFVYGIDLKNLETTDLENAELAIRFPEGFTFEDSSLAPIVPAPDPTRPGADTSSPYFKQWDLGTIAIGTAQTLSIRGVMLAAVGSKQSITATLSYQPRSFTSRFEETATAATEVTDSVLGLQLIGPRQAATDDRTDYSIVLKNNGTRPVEHASIAARIPQRFSVQAVFADFIAADADPAGLADRAVTLQKDAATPGRWEVLRLEPGQSYAVILRGTYSGDRNESVAVEADAALTGSLGDSIQRTASAATEIIASELVVRLIVAGSEESTPVNFGDTLNYLVSVENKSVSTIGDVSVRALIDSDLIDWATVSDARAGSVDRPYILWTKEQVPELAMLLPGSEVAIPFSIRVKPYAASLREPSEGYAVKNIVDVTVAAIDNVETKKSVASPSVINRVNSNTSFESYARYFDDQQQAVGSGPLPPIVDQTTAYRIYWRIKNSVHELNEIRVQAPLPAGVAYTERQQASAGSVYRGDGNTIVWEINRIPTSVDTLTASFDVSITPSTGDAEKILSLLGGAQLVATDAATKGAISKNAGGLTTSLDLDPLAKDKGLVRKSE